MTLVTYSLYSKNVGHNKNGNQFIKLFTGDYIGTQKALGGAFSGLHKKPSGLKYWKSREINEGKKSKWKEKFC